MLAVPLIILGAVIPLAAAYSLGRLLFRGIPQPAVVSFGAGAAVLSHLTLALVWAGWADRWLLLALCLLPVAAGVYVCRTGLLPSWPGWRRFGAAQWGAAVVFGAYGVYYAVHAMAPEIRPDGYTYHLGLPREWLRTGGFPDRAGFYEMLPQGLEMLFVHAFAIGRHSAAKLVHLAFLIATAPLLFAVCRRLALPGWAALAASGLYLFSPVVATAGTAAYNDAALVFFVLTTFYLWLAWDQDRADHYLIPLGLAAGFCYSIKFTGIIVAPLVAALVALRKRPKAALAVAAAAALMIVPWLARNTIQTGNPFAPLFNSIFPNPHFHVSTEQYLGQSLRSYEGVTWANHPLELTVKGQRLQGLIGPVFLLAPLGLLALRRRTGRMLLAAGLWMAVPWFFNIGARFLMPSLPFAALALVSVLPRHAALAVFGVHALSCLPPVVAMYADPGAWTLRGFPWQAALRLQPEEDYLTSELWEYGAVKLIEQHVPAEARVLDLLGAPNAYLDAITISPWQMAAGDRAAYALQVAAAGVPGVLTEFHAEWPEQELTALIVQPATPEGYQWGVNDLRLYRGATLLRLQSQWKLLARPNAWEARFAFDQSLMSRWGTWSRPGRRDVHLGTDFGAPVRLSGARVVCQAHEQRGALLFRGRLPSGEWELLSSPANPAPLDRRDLRRSAIRVALKEGFGYVLAPASESGYGGLTEALISQPGDWGIQVAGGERNLYLINLDPGAGSEAAPSL